MMTKRTKRAGCAIAVLVAVGLMSFWVWHRWPKNTEAPEGAPSAEDLTPPEVEIPDFGGDLGTPMDRSDLGTPIDPSELGEPADPPPLDPPANERKPPGEGQ